MPSTIDCVPYSLYPGATFAIGPPITDGFYYDFDIGRPFTPEDLDQIEARMEEIIAIDQTFDRESLSIDDALELFADQPFKSEIISWSISLFTGSNFRFCKPRSFRSKTRKAETSSSLNFPRTLVRILSKGS